jgi:hypothetical protein
MQENPLVCSLTTADYRDREGAWLKLAPYVRSSTSIPGGLNLMFAATIGLRDSLTELVRLEAECCAWMTFAMVESLDGVRLSITSNSEDGERGVREAFAPLARGQYQVGFSGVAGAFAGAYARPSASPLDGGCPVVAASAGDASPTKAEGQSPRQ